MWIKIIAWEGQVYPDPAGPPVDVRDGSVVEVPPDYGAVLVAKGIGRKTSAPKTDGSKPTDAAPVAVDTLETL